MSADRVVVVTRPTRLEELTDKYLTEGGAEFELESRGGDIAPFRREHDTYVQSLETVLGHIPKDLPVTIVPRHDLPYFLFRPEDLVIVCGPDGLLVNTARFLGNQLVLGVNPDPSVNAGVLTSCPPERVRRALTAGIAGDAYYRPLPFVKAVTDRGDTLWGLNEIFAGRLDHVSARYSIQYAGKTERHVSSGVIAATGVGCGGWIRSIVAMIEGLGSEGTRQDHLLMNLPADTAREVVFAVREPFPSPDTGTSMVTGRLVGDAALELTCEMPEGGVILSDGLVDRAVEWAAGSAIIITCGERTLRHIIA